MNDTAFDAAAAVRSARIAIGRGTKRDTPAQVLRHVARQRELAGASLTPAERKTVQCEAELRIAFEQWQAARERYAKAELAAGIAEAKRNRREVA